MVVVVDDYSRRGGAVDCVDGVVVVVVVAV